MTLSFARWFPLLTFAQGELASRSQKGVIKPPAVPFPCMAAMVSNPHQQGVQPMCFYNITREINEREFKGWRWHGDVAIHMVNQLTDLEKKHIRSSNNLTFLLRCRDLMLIPKGLKLRSPVNCNSAKKILHRASQRLVKDRIRHYTPNLYIPPRSN